MNCGKKRVNSVLCLCTRFGAELPQLEGEKVIELNVCRKSTFQKFGQGVIETQSPVGGRVRLVLVIAFVDVLPEGELLICSLHVGFPYGIEM